MNGVRHILAIYFKIMRGKIINIRAVIQVTCNFIDTIDWYRKNTGRVVIVTAWVYSGLVEYHGVG